MSEEITYPQGAAAFFKRIRVSRSPDTLATYESFLRRFQIYLVDEDSDLDTFNVDDVYGFIEENEWSPNTTNTFIAVSKSLSSFQLGKVRTSMDPKQMADAMDAQHRWMQVMKMDRVKVAEEIRQKALSLDDLKRLLVAAHNRPRSYHWKRVWILFYTGARKAELQQKLVFDDRTFNEETGRLILKTAKGKHVQKERIVYLEPSITLPLFIQLRDGEFSMGESRSSLNKMYEYVTQGIEFPIHITPHTSRHTFNTHMKKILGDDILVKRLMGHSTKSEHGETGTYTHYDEDEFRSAMVSKHYMTPLLSLVRRWHL